MHAEIRPDVNGVMVSGDTLLIGPESRVQRARAAALLQHEVGTHLVTQVNGTHQPIKVLGVGLAGYDETQEGLAVLAEIACGGLTAFRLRQLAGRVVDRAPAHRRGDVRRGPRGPGGRRLPAGSAFTTVMRVYRSGGLTKDAIYLRGLLELLEHLGGGGVLDLLLLGKFSLGDLPLVGRPAATGACSTRPRVLPRYLHDPAAAARLDEGRRAPKISSTLLEGRTMKIGFVVNDIDDREAAVHHHPARHGGQGRWATRPGTWASATSPTSPTGRCSAKARAGDGKSYRSLERYLEDVQKPDGRAAARPRRARRRHAAQRPGRRRGRPPVGATTPGWRSAS